MDTLGLLLLMGLFAKEYGNLTFNKKLDYNVLQPSYYHKTTLRVPGALFEFYIKNPGSYNNEILVIGSFFSFIDPGISYRTPLGITYEDPGVI